MLKSITSVSKLIEDAKTSDKFVYQLFFNNTDEDCINPMPQSSMSKLSEHRVIMPSNDFYLDGFSIPTITITDQYTILDINICKSGDGYYVNANSDASLIDATTGISYKLLKVENVQLSPKKTYFYRDILYRLYFEKLPDSTNKIQLCNGGIFRYMGSTWKVKLNIKNIYW